MPLFKLETTANLSDQSRTDLLTKLPRMVAETIGKPEEYVMVTVSQGDILMSRQPGHAAFVELAARIDQPAAIGREFQNAETSRSIRQSALGAVRQIPEGDVTGLVRQDHYLAVGREESLGRFAPSGGVLWSWADYYHCRSFVQYAVFGPYGVVTVDRRPKAALATLTRMYGGEEDK